METNIVISLDSAEKQKKLTQEKLSKTNIVINSVFSLFSIFSLSFTFWPQLDGMYPSYAFLVYV